ncbi:alpha/beta fold hydrolase [Natrialbaceae archaeon A-CW3]
MNTSSIYKSEAGERRIKEIYDDLVDDLDTDLDRQFVDTRFGETHVLVTGDPDSPPLFVFHGGNMANPVSLSWFLPLADYFHLHAPDTVGHPGYSSQTRLSPRDGSYGRWAADLLDAFGYDRVPMVGPSYGGGIVLHAATEIPDRIERAGLINPSGLGTGSVVRMVRRVIVPMVIYRLTGQQRWLRRSIEPIFSEPLTEVDERIIELVALSYDEVKLETEFPRTVDRSDLTDFSAPTFLTVTERDIFFPSDVVVSNAKRAIPNLKIIVRLRGESHFPNPQARDEMISHLRDFLTQSAGDR